MIVIAGAGLTGLSTAFHLKDRAYRILEKEGRPGGLCRTETYGDYQFDYAGHLLHFRDDSIKSLVRDLLADNRAEITRRSAIFSHNVITEYPFQVNLHGLPQEVVRDCLVGFVEALMEGEKSKDAKDDYEGWILQTFGRGIAEHFMLPFNRKFWQVDLREVRAKELLWAVPQPKIEEVIEGALGISERSFGYNQSFDYPRQGGIEALVKAFLARVRNPETGRELVKIIPGERRCILRDGEEIGYNVLVSTVPLPELIKMIHRVPAEIAEAAAGLRSLEVLCVNLGLAGPPVTDRHWIYFSEDRFPFHRLGVYSNFFEAREDRHSLYLELCGQPGRFEGREEEWSEKAAAALLKSGLLQSSHRIELRRHLKIKYGYVIFDRHREEKRPMIISYLQEQGIYAAGRYGRWEYSTMEEAIRQGREMAKRF